MKLTEADRLSSTWVKLTQYLNERIDIHRKKNDGDLDPIATARLRARIKEMQHILSLADSKEISEE